MGEEFKRGTSALSPWAHSADDVTPDTPARAFRSRSTCWFPRTNEPSALPLKSSLAPGEGVQVDAVCFDATEPCWAWAVGKPAAANTASTLVVTTATWVDIDSSQNYCQIQSAGILMCQSGKFWAYLLKRVQPLVHARYPLFDSLPRSAWPDLVPMHAARSPERARTHRLSPPDRLHVGG